jgi:hypothetical protein
MLMMSLPLAAGTGRRAADEALISAFGFGIFMVGILAI